MVFSQRSKSCNRLCLAPLKTRLKSLEPSSGLNTWRGPLLNSHDLLDKLRYRDSVTKKVLDPSQIIKNDLVPMLEGHSKTGFLDRVSLDSQPLGSSRSGPKLSEQLNEKLQSAYEQLLMTQNSQSVASSHIHSGLAEIRVLRAKLKESFHILSFLKYKCKCLSPVPDSLSLNNWKFQSESKLRRNSLISQELFRECKMNAELREKESKLKHLSCFLGMKNDVMGDQLKNLYEISTVLYTNTNFRDIFIAPLISMYKDALTQNNDRLYAWKLVKSINLNTLSNAIDHTQKQKDILCTIRSFKIQARDRLQILERKIRYTKNELDNQHRALEYTNNKLEGLRSLYTRTKCEYKKLFNNQGNRKEEEKVCKNCRAIFIDSENFNSSCKIHPSPWNGNVYWCCGSTIPNTPGCFQCKHISTDEEIDDFNIQDFCSCCKEYGHKFKCCPKDSNVRSDSNINEELFRVSALKIAKKRVMRPLFLGAPENEEEEWEELNQARNECILKNFFRKNRSNFDDCVREMGESRRTKENLDA